MRRALLSGVLFALAPQALAQDIPASACVVKEEGARSARKRLRYRGRLRVAENLQLVLWQEIRREFDGGQAPQSQRGPQVVLDLEITPGRFENGVTYFTVRVTEASAAGGTANAEQVAALNRCVVALKGLLGQGGVAQDGSGLELRWEGLARGSPGTRKGSPSRRVRRSQAWSSPCHRPRWARAAAGWCPCPARSDRASRGSRRSGSRVP